MSGQISKVTDKKKSAFILAGVSLGVFISKLDTYIVNISLPVITDYYKTDKETVSYVLIMYLLASTCTLLLFGKLGDRKGLKNLFVTGFFVFTFGSLMCGLSSSVYILITSRFIQGLGGAMLTGLAGAIVSKYFPEKSIGKSFGILTMINAFGIFLGAPLGGIITEYLSWHWIFFVNIPIGIFAVFFTRKYIPSDKTSAVNKKQSFDYIGAFLSMLLITSLIFITDFFDDYGLMSYQVLILFLAFVSSAALFLYRESRASDALLDLGLFKSLPFTFAIFATLVAYIPVTGSNFLMPYYIQNELGLKPDLTGYIILIYSATIIIVAPYSGKLSDRINPNYITCSSAGFGIITYFLFAVLLSGYSIFYVILFMLLNGITFGFFASSNNHLVMSFAPEDKKGVVSATLYTFTNFSAIFGVKIFETIYSCVSAKLPDSGIDRFIPYQYAYITGGIAEIVTFGLSIIIIFYTGRKFRRIHEAQ